jgi:hypothetical protein
MLSLVTDNSFELFKLLIKHGADVHVKDRNGRNIVYWAAVLGRRPDLKYILENYPDFDINEVDAKGNTILDLCLKASVFKKNI